MADDRDHLIAMLDQTREALYATLVDVDWQHIAHAATGWRVQDVISHIAVWEVEMNRSLHAHAEGGEYVIPNIMMMDEYNEREYQHRRQWTLDQVRTELESARAEFLTLLRAMPASLIHQPIRTPWGPLLPMPTAILVMAEHEREHTRQIRRAVGKLP